MKTYKVYYKEIVEYKFYVDAESEDKVEEELNKMISNGNINFDDGFVVHSDIEYIREVQVMTKAELDKIMKENYIFPSELDDVIQFVQDLLEFQAKELEKNEPYAVNTIRRLKDAAHEVWGLQEYIENAMEEEEE